MMSIIQKIKTFKRKLNFFDLAIIFSLLAILGFFIYNRLQRQATWVEVRISVENPDWWYRGSPPNYWYAQNLKVGDSLNDSFGNKVVEVVNIDNYDNYASYRNIYVDLKVRVDYDKKKNQYLYEFKPLTVGSSLLFNFSSGQLRGLVTKVDGEEVVYFEQTIKVGADYASRLHQDNPSLITKEFAEKIEVGQKAYDANGNIIAEILKVDRHPATYYEFSDVRGRNVLVQNPDFYDLELVLKIKAFETYGVKYFINNAALKVGNAIWFQFPEFALEDMRIIELLD